MYNSTWCEWPFLAVQPLAETALYLPLSLQSTDLPTRGFTFWHYRAIPETCDLWDIWSEWWRDMTWQFPKKKMDFPRKMDFLREKKWISWERKNGFLEREKGFPEKKGFPERKRWISRGKKDFPREKNLISRERNNWFPKKEMDLPRKKGFYNREKDGFPEKKHGFPKNFFFTGQKWISW